MIFVRTWLPGYESTAPVADIMGPQEQRVPSGSTITLRCVILSPYQIRPIRGVQWLRDNKLLTFQVMHPQLDTRFNEISVWRSEIGRSGEGKKSSYIIKRATLWEIWVVRPLKCVFHIFVCVLSLRRLFLSRDTWREWRETMAGNWSIWQFGFCRCGHVRLFHSTLDTCCVSLETLISNGFTAFFRQHFLFIIYNLILEKNFAF